MLADFVDHDDVRVLELRGSGGLGGEPPAIGAARQGAVQDEFDGDGAVEARLPRLVDDAHAAAGDFAEDFVAGQLG